MNPHVLTSLSLVKDNLTRLETVSAVGASVPESHPRRCSVTARDLVPAVDGVAAALTGHLVVTCSAYSALPHLVNLKDSAFITS